MRKSAEQENFPKSADDRFIEALIDENIELREVVVALLRSVMDVDRDGINEFLFSSRLTTDQMATCADLVESA